MAFGAAFTGMLPAQSVAIGLLPHKAGTIGGLITLSISGGGIVMPALLAGMVATLGWRSTFIVTGAIVLLTVVPLGWFVLKGHGSHSAAAHGEGAAIEAGSRHLTTRALLGNLAFWIPLTGIIPVMFVVGTVLTNSVAIATDSGIAIGTASYLVSIIAVGGAIGSVGIGWIADRSDYRIVFAAIATALIISLLLLMGRVGLLPMALAFAVVGFAGGGVIPLLAVIIVRSFGPSGFPRVMGLMMPGLVISMAVAPVIAGLVRDATGSYRIAFGYCALLMALSCLAILTLKVAATKPEEMAAGLPG
jgi:MFS family permease